MRTFLFLSASTISVVTAFVPMIARRSNPLPMQMQQHRPRVEKEGVVLFSTSENGVAEWKHKACNVIAAGLFFASAAVGNVPSAHAESRVVGQISGSGLVFKDTLQVESFDDPKVRGVTLYISNFQRPITERFSSARNFFSDPSNSAVACARTGKQVEIADNINKSPQGEEVFEESKSLLFKSLRVQRIYDEEKGTVVYVSFNTRLNKDDDDNKSRFQNSLCAVNLN